MRTPLAAWTLATCLVCASARASNFTIVGAGGTFADNNGTGTYQSTQPTALAFSSSVTIPNNVTEVTSLTISHIVSPWAADLQVVLRDPTGRGTNIFVRPGLTTSILPHGNQVQFGTVAVPGADLTILQTSTGFWQQSGFIGTGSFPQYYGNTTYSTWTDGNHNIFNTNFLNVTGPSGVWRLEVYDWFTANVGSITGWTLVCKIADTGTPFCPGDGTSGTCPCSNSGTSGRGCDNSAGTGGALLTGTGAPSLSSDSVVFTTSGELPTVLSIFAQGTLQITAVNFGDGLRCVGGSLKRLFIKNAVNGSAMAPLSGDLSVSARSAALGDTITAGSTRYYYTYYRDPSATFCAAPPGNTFNITSQFAIFWTP